MIRRGGLYRGGLLGGLYRGGRIAALDTPFTSLQALGQRVSNQANRVSSQAHRVVDEGDCIEVGILYT